MLLQLGDGYFQNSLKCKILNSNLMFFPRLATAGFCVEMHSHTKLRWKWISWFYAPENSSIIKYQVAHIKPPRDDDFKLLSARKRFLGIFWFHSSSLSTLEIYWLKIKNTQCIIYHQQRRELSWNLFIYWSSKRVRARGVDCE